MVMNRRRWLAAIVGMCVCFLMAPCCVRYAFHSYIVKQNATVIANNKSEFTRVGLELTCYGTDIAVIGRGDQITDAALQACAAKMGEINVTFVLLSDTRVTDSGLRTLSKIATLRTVLLYELLGVSDQGVVALSELPNLAHLEVYGCSVSNSIEQEIRQRCPKAATRFASNQ